MSLESRIKEIQRRRRQSDAGLDSGSHAASKKDHVPDWSDPMRRAPNAILRSALFSAIGKGRRQYFHKRVIHSLSGTKITYTGIQLDQGDMDVILTLMHAARDHELGMECRITAYRLLMALGKTDTGKNRQALDGHISRIKAGGLEIRVGSFSYEGSLIDEVYREPSTGRYVICLNARLRGLLMADQFTQVDWSIRRVLTGKPLAQWLHGFYSSHASPYPLRVDTLHRLCGSSAVLMSDFRKDLRRGLRFLEEAYASKGQLFSSEFHGDLLHVRTTPSPSQKKHLARRRSIPL